MKLISVSVARPIELRHGDGLIKTGIFKHPVTGPVYAGRYNLEGDGQADLENHGGAHKAVYAYSADHYPYWRETLGRKAIDYGGFGENLTVAGLDETERCIGDRLQIGGAQFTISQPRVPCYKLGIRFERADMVKRFLQSRRLGFYLRVLREGVIEAGQPIQRLSREPEAPTIADLALLETTGEEDRTLLQRAVRASALTQGWRDRYREQLDKLTG